MANENLLTKFTNDEFGEIRVITIDEEPMFVGKDLVEKLGYNLLGKHVASEYIKKYCDEDDYILIDKNSPLQQGAVLDYKILGQRGGYLVNESGMYSLVLGSELPSSKKFKRWITKEVLPKIRKHGAYINDNSDTVDKDYVKYARGTIKETFMNCPVENLLDEYDNAMKFYSDKNNKLTYYSEKGMNKTNRKYRSDKKLSVNESKLEISNTIKKALKERDKQLCDKGIIGCSRDLQATMNYISENITKINNSIKAGQLSAKTRENNKLKEYATCNN